MQVNSSSRGLGNETMTLAWRNVVALATLLHGAVGCGTVEDGDVVGEPLVFLDEYFTEAAPLGIWCISRAGASLRAVPSCPTDAGFQSKGCARWEPLE